MLSGVERCYGVVRIERNIVFSTAHVNPRGNPASSMVNRCGHSGRMQRDADFTTSTTLPFIPNSISFAYIDFCGLLISGIEIGLDLGQKDNSNVIFFFRDCLPMYLGSDK